MSLIDISVVKKKFPKWSSFCDASESQLQNAIDDAEAEFSFYLDIDADKMTNFLRLLLMNIIRKKCFDIDNADKEFETKPGIVKDYEKTLLLLTDVKTGQISLTGSNLSGTGNITMSAGKKVFDNWFNKPSGSISISEMEDQYDA